MDTFTCAVVEGLDGFEHADHDLFILSLC